MSSKEVMEGLEFWCEATTRHFRKACRLHLLLPKRGLLYHMERNGNTHKHTPVCFLSQVETIDQRILKGLRGLCCSIVSSCSCWCFWLGLLCHLIVAV